MSFSIFLEPYNQYSQMAKGNVDKLKLAESSYLLGGKWFEACEKVSERLFISLNVEKNYMKNSWIQFKKQRRLNHECMCCVNL
jgi:hypothetical protein